jgi:hypothetical protein
MAEKRIESDLKIKGNSNITQDLSVDGVSNQSGIYSIENNILRLSEPKGGTADLGGGGVTGAIKIALPVYTINAMVTFDIDIYQYATDTSTTNITVGGYLFSVQWSNPFAYILSGSENDYPIRFGHDGTNMCIWIGETTSTWDYPKVAIRNVQVGHGTPSLDWIGSWGVSLVQGFNTVQQTKTDNFSYADFNKLKNLTATNTQLVLGDGTGKDISDFQEAGDFLLRDGSLPMIGGLKINYTGSEYDLDISNNNIDSDKSYIRLGVVNKGEVETLGSGLIFKPEYTAGNYTKRSAGIMQTAEGNYFRSGLAFFTNNSANQTTDWQERMRINMHGNVGIGTTTPTEKLDVVGNIQSSGNFIGARFKASNPGSTSWNSYGNTNVSYRTEIADGSSAYWIWSAGTGSTFKTGLQVLGTGVGSRLYNVNGDYISFSGSTVDAGKIINRNSSDSEILLGGGGTKAVSDFVDVSSAQTISGEKTFNNDIRLANNVRLDVGDGRAYLTGSGPHTEFSGIGNITIQADNDLASETEYLDLRAGYNSLKIGGGSLGDKITYNGETIYHAGNLTNVSQLNNDAGYLTAETDSQTLSWDDSTGNLTISNGNSQNLDGRYLHGLKATYNSVSGDTGANEWYTLFYCKDNSNSPITCNIRAYAHTSMSFVVVKGYSTIGSITILNYTTSANAGYRYIQGVRLLSDGTVQIKLNGDEADGITITQIDVQVNGSDLQNIGLVSDLTVYTGTPTIAHELINLTPTKGIITTKVLADNFIIDGASNLDVLLGDGSTMRRGGASGDYNDYITWVGSDGVMEVGKYIDFHEVTSTNDYDVRLTATPTRLTSSQDLYVNSSKVFHEGNLTNVSQLINDAGYLTSYTETDTLQSVTDRNPTTNNAISITNNTGSESMLLNYSGIEFNRGGNYIAPDTNGTKSLNFGASTKGVQDWFNINIYGTGQFRYNNNDIYHTGNLPTYDNYQSWNLKTNGVQRTTVQSGGTLDIVAQNNISVSYSAGGVVTLDGTHDHYYIQNYGTNSFLQNATYGTQSGVLNVPSTANGNPTNDWYHRIKMLHNNTNGYFTEIAVAMTGAEAMYYKQYESGVDNGWIRLWDNKNLQFGTGASNMATGNHVHSLLTNGAGLTGSNYNGSSATTWDLDEGWLNTRYFDLDGNNIATGNNTFDGDVTLKNGQFLVHTANGSNPFIVARLIDDLEQTIKLYVEDTIGHFYYTEDERNGRIKFTLDNTDSTNGGVNANLTTFEIVGNENESYLALNGNRVITAANIGNYQAGSHTHSLSDITDVNINTPLNGHILQYSTVSGKWENIASSAIGLQASDIDTLAELNNIVTDATLIDTNDPRLSDARTPTAHNHDTDYVKKSGDVMTGMLDINSTSGAETGTVTNPATIRLSDNIPTTTSTHDRVNQYASVEFYSNDASNDGARVRAKIGSTYDHNYGASTALTFFTTETTGAAQERVRISALGNVGIGTTNPTETLDVAGNIKLSGDLHLYGGTKIKSQASRISFLTDVGAALKINTNELLVSNSYAHEPRVPTNGIYALGAIESPEGFIKSGATSNDILLGDGTTRTVDTFHPAYKNNFRFWHLKNPIGHSNNLEEQINGIQTVLSSNGDANNWYKSSLNGFTNIGDNYYSIGVAKVYVNTDTLVDCNVGGDDATSIFIDGREIAAHYGAHGNDGVGYKYPNTVSNAGTRTTDPNRVVTYPSGYMMTKGWHVITILHTEVAGGDGLTAFIRETPTTPEVSGSGTNTGYVSISSLIDLNFIDDVVEYSPQEGFNEVKSIHHNYDSTYVKKSGDTMTGQLTIEKLDSTHTWLNRISSGGLANYSGFWSNAPGDIHLYLRDANGNPNVILKPDSTSTFTNSISASSFVKSGGTGSNVLLDDGNIKPLSDFEMEGDFLLRDGSLPMTGTLQVEDGEIHVGDISADSWTKLAHVNANDYGFTFQHNNATVIVNEQGTTNQAIVLPDTNPHSTNTLFGVSSKTGATGWIKFLDLRGDGELFLGETGQQVYHTGNLTNVSQLTNDTGFISTETDPTVPSHVKDITTTDIDKWSTLYSEVIDKDYVGISNISQVVDGYKKWYNFISNNQTLQLIGSWTTGAEIEGNNSGTTNLVIQHLSGTNLTRITPEGFKNEVIPGGTFGIKFITDTTYVLVGALVSDPNSGGTSGGGGGSSYVAPTGNVVDLASGITPTSNITLTNPERATNDDISSKTYYTSFGSGSSSTSGAEGDYIEIDLGTVRTVTGNKIYFYNALSRFYYYKVKYSEDGVTWNYLVGDANTFETSQPGNDKPEEYTYVPSLNINARYWRVYANGNNVNTVNHLYEWDIMGYDGNPSSGTNPDFEPEFQAVLDYASANGIPLPSTAEQQACNEELIHYKNIGAWDKDDVFFRFKGTADPAFKLICWKRLIQADAFGSLTWDDNGVLGNGTNGYINPKFAPSIDGVNFTQDDAGLTTVFHANSVSTNSTICGGYDGVNGDGYTIWADWWDSANALNFLNSKYETSTRVFDELGFAGLYRTSSSLVTRVTQTITAEYSDTATGILSKTFYIMARARHDNAGAADTFGDAHLKYFMMGGSKVSETPGMRAILN